jgi:hypothetical protein
MEDWDLYNNVVDTSLNFVVLHQDGAMKLLQFHLNNELVEDIDEILYLNLVDINKVFKLTIRNSILDYEEVDAAGSEAATLSIKDTCDLSNAQDVLCWGFLLAGLVPWASTPPALVSNGTPDDVVHFFSYFDFGDEQNGGYKPE